MDVFWSCAIIGGVTGGIVAYFKALSMNREMRQRPCPDCDEVLGSSQPPKRTRQQVLWGGWTCPHCGCDIDRYGNERKHERGIGNQNDWQGLKPNVEDWFSNTRSFRDILRQPHVLVLEPHLFIIKPWLVVILFAMAGLLVGIVAGIAQGTASGDVLEASLLLGFVGFVVASIAGAAFASVLWLVRVTIRIILRRSSRVQK